jgi:hypothetical protein
MIKYAKFRCNKNRIFFFFAEYHCSAERSRGNAAQQECTLNPPVFVYSVICDMFRPVTEIIHIRHWELLPSLHIHLHVIVKVLGIYRTHHC